MDKKFNAKEYARILEERKKALKEAFIKKYCKNKN